ncbi:unnamed protein product [Rhodiola kirilowii]
MSCLSWNYRGLGGAATVRALANLVRVHKPSLVGVMGTKAEKSRMEQVRIQLGFECGFSVERNGRSDGLALWWKKNLNISVKRYSDYHIDTIVEHESPFRVTLFYGQPMVNRRAETWELLRSLSADWDLPWLVFGDFNEVLFGWEVKGFRGSTFTFSNKRKGIFETKARLDRALANQDWRNLFPAAEVIYEISGMSDHSPIVIKWEGDKRMKKLKLSVLSQCG